MGATGADEWRRGDPRPSSVGGEPSPAQTASTSSSSHSRSSSSDGSGSGNSSLPPLFPRSPSSSSVDESPVSLESGSSPVAGGDDDAVETTSIDDGDANALPVAGSSSSSFSSSEAAAEAKAEAKAAGGGGGGEGPTTAHNYPAAEERPSRMDTSAEESGPDAPASSAARHRGRLGRLIRTNENDLADMGKQVELMEEDLTRWNDRIDSCFIRTPKKGSERVIMPRRKRHRMRRSLQRTRQSCGQRQ